MADIQDDDAPVRPIFRGRRAAVSAETQGSAAPIEKKVFPKSEEEKNRLKAFVRGNILFQHLNGPELDEVVDAFFPMELGAGEEIISQGAEGDNFYIIDKGECEVFVTSKQSAEPLKVQDRAEGASFGELALMYNAPRAASVKTRTGCRLWALDRSTFTFILRNSGESKMSSFIGFLSNVEVLRALDRTEFAKLADALKEQEFADGDCIVRQGEKGERFYIVLQGATVARREHEDGRVEDLMTYRQGQCFGERALLTDEPRAASVFAVGTVRVGCIEKESFEALLGPCEEVLRDHMEKMGYSK